MSSASMKCTVKELCSNRRTGPHPYPRTQPTLLGRRRPNGLPLRWPWLVAGGTGTPSTTVSPSATAGWAALDASSRGEERSATYAFASTHMRPRQWRAAGCGRVVDRPMRSRRPRGGGEGTSGRLGFN